MEPSLLTQVLVTHPRVSYNRFPMDGVLPWVCAESHNPILNTSTQLVEIGCMFPYCWEWRNLALGI